MSKVYTVKCCRNCGFSPLKTYLELGQTPLANAYLRAKELHTPEFKADLSLQICLSCGLSQLSRVVPPARMFRNYLYASSTPRTFRDHCAEFAKEAIPKVTLSVRDRVVDIGSNDGCLLSYFKAKRIPVLGIDPAVNLGREARRKGIPTLTRYWDLSTASFLLRKYGPIRLMVSTNVLAHVHDAHGFVEGISKCLAEDGLWAFEVPYLLDFIRHNEFDTAYHEHLSYFAVHPLVSLVAAHGLSLFDLDYFPSLHGGTLRGWVSRAGRRPASAALKRFLKMENAFGLKRLAPYQAFSRRVRTNQKKIVSLLKTLKRKNKTVWAYGAAAKGNTLLNVFGINHRQIDLILDDNPRKWGLYTPGSHIPITGNQALQASSPDYMLILVWNFAAEIIARCRRAGYKGSFILPVPVPRIVR